jgi:ribonuclease J
LVLDGDVILPADGATMTERRRIASHGYIAVTIALDADEKLVGKPSIQIQGIPVEEDRDDFLDDASDAAIAACASASKAEQRNEAVRLAVRRTAVRWTGKKPVVQVAVMEV